MKNIVLFILLITGIFTFHAQNQILFVNLEDGTQDLFLFNEIKQISYSKTDLEGLEHSDYCTQEITTKDGVFKYNLSDIVDLGFQTPEAKLRMNALDLSGDIYKYITGSEDMEIFLSSSTPDYILPKIGDGVYAIEPSQKLPFGLCGIVNSISYSDNHITLICKEADPSELFEEIYTVNDSYIIEGEEENVGSYHINTTRGAVEEKTNKIPVVVKEKKLSVSLTGDCPSWMKDGIFEENTEAYYKAGSDGTFSLTLITAVKNGKTFRKFISNFDTDYQISCGFVGKINSDDKKTELTLLKLRNIRIGWGLGINLYLKLFYDMELTGGLEYTYSNGVTANSSFGLITSYLPGFIPKVNEWSNPMFSWKKGEHSLKAVCSASINAGLRLQPEIFFISDKTMNLSFKWDPVVFGLEFELPSQQPPGWNESESTTELYDYLEENSFLKFLIKPQFSVNLILLNHPDWGFNKTSELNPYFEYQFRMVPHFSKPVFSQTGSQGNLTYGLYNGCLMPQKVGIMTQYEGKTSFYSSDEKFSSFSNDGDFTVSTNFPFTESTSLKAWPFVELFPGKTLKATPGWPFSLDGAYPYFYNASTPDNSIRVTGGAWNMAEGEDENTAVQVGNPFLFEN